ncbi:exostoses (multiple)-like 2 [Balamuthia mandrillaris]
MALNPIFRPLYFRRKMLTGIAVYLGVLIFLTYISMNHVGSMYTLRGWVHKHQQKWEVRLGDEDHRQKEKDMLALAEFKHRRFIYENSHLLCQHDSSHSKDATGGGGKERMAWLTATINDDYVVPAVALAHSIQKFSCVKTMLAIISDALSPSSRNALTRAGWQLLERPPLDCAHEGQEGIDDLAKIRGAHMRFHAWNLTEYDRLIYMDCDIMLLDNVDELFEMPLEHDEIYASYFAAPGVVTWGLNSGIMVLRPSEATCVAMLKEWRALFSTTGCMNDQPYLWIFFSQPGRQMRFLPYAYNVRKDVYHPMRVYHLAGPRPQKVWLYPRSREEAKNVPIINTPEDVSSVWWFMFYDALDGFGLHEWWQQLHSPNSNDNKEHSR